MKKLVLAILMLWALSGTVAMAQTRKELKTQKLSKPSIAVMGLPGAWWRNPNNATALSLTPDQQKKMDDVFQDSRLNLIDANARLEKEELVLQPLMNADRVDEAQVLSQIDRVAHARAELEKVNARMLLGIRLILTPEQWTSLQEGRLKLTKNSIKDGVKSKLLK